MVVFENHPDRRNPMTHRLDCCIIPRVTDRLVGSIVGIMSTITVAWDSHRYGRIENHPDRRNPMTHHLDCCIIPRVTVIGSIVGIIVGIHIGMVVLKTIPIEGIPWRTLSSFSQLLSQLRQMRWPSQWRCVMICVTTPSPNPRVKECGHLDS